LYCHLYSNQKVNSGNVENDRGSESEDQRDHPTTLPNMTLSGSTDQRKNHTTALPPRTLSSAPTVLSAATDVPERVMPSSSAPALRSVGANLDSIRDNRSTFEEGNDDNEARSKVTAAGGQPEMNTLDGDEGSDGKPVASTVSEGSKGPINKIKRFFRNGNLKNNLIIALLCAFAISLVVNVFQAASQDQHEIPSSSRSSHNKTLNAITAKGPEVKALLNNPALRQAFYGINYSPLNALYPNCGVTQRDVILDIAVLSQLTNRVRLYGTDCNQAALTLNAIQALEVDMTVSLGVWVGEPLDVTLRQLSDMRDILNEYPRHLINSILVGNEVLFRGDLSADKLIGYIDYVREYLRQHNISDIPVGTSEIGSKWTGELAQHVDILAANIHPFFGGVDVHDSTKWTYDFLLREVTGSVVSPANLTYVISEVGWPSGGGALQGAVAGINEMQIFLDKWLCNNQDTDVGWYWFEAFDEPWKERWNTDEAKWETQWGLFTSDRKLKGIVIPACTEDDEPVGQ
jgi:exo-beta-1,3-glucanase (GH17 family)